MIDPSRPFFSHVIDYPCFHTLPMHHVLIYYMMLCAVSSSAAGCLQSGTLSDPQHALTLTEFETDLESLRKELRIPGMSGAIEKDGRVVWARGFGEADREKNVAADTGSVFHLASLTKPYAAAVLLQLVEEGQLNLDDPVSAFGVELEGEYDAADTVRVRHLLSHTSDAPPGSTYRYDGIAYGQLTRVIEEVAGRPFAAVLADRIIRPLGLRRTAPDPRDSAAVAAAALQGNAVQDNFVTNYARAWGRSIWPSGLLGPMRPMDQSTGFNAATGLAASARDVARFAAALDAGCLMSDSMRTLAGQPILTPSGEKLPYGLGWFVQEVEGVRVLWHYGHWYSDSALIVRVPEQRLTLVVLANSDGLSRWRGLGDHADIRRSLVAEAFFKTAVFRSAVARHERGVPPPRMPQSANCNIGYLDPST